MTQEDAVYNKEEHQNHSYIQHQLPEPKVTYMSSNYSTAILQHKEQSPAAIAEGLNIFLSHASGTHEYCPTNTWCQWRQTSTSSKQPSTAQTKFIQLDIDKTKEAVLYSPNAWYDSKCQRVPAQNLLEFLSEGYSD